MDAIVSKRRKSRAQHHAMQKVNQPALGVRCEGAFFTRILDKFL
jgi:hypothetical protein